MVKISLSTSARENDFICLYVFSLFCHYLPLETGVTLQLKQNLNTFHTKMYYAKFSKIFPVAL